MAFIDEITPTNELQNIFVEEWNKDVYFYPFTLADLDYVKRMCKGNDGEFIAYYLIRKCLDDQGKQRFSVADKQSLMRKFPSDVLAGIVGKMRGDVGENAGEQAVKNSE